MRLILTGAGAAIAAASLIIMFILPAGFFPSAQEALQVKMLSSIACGVGAGLAVAGALMAPRGGSRKEAKAGEEGPKTVVRGEVKITPPSARKMILLYADLIAAALFSALLLYIMLLLPSGFFTSPLAEIYARLASSMLLGFTASIIILLLSEILRPRSVKIPLRPEAKPLRPAIKPIRLELPVSFVSKKKSLKSMAEKISLSFSRDVIEAGESISPYRLACQSLFYTIIAVLAAIPASTALAILIHPAFLALMVLPILLFLLPKIKLRVAVGDRRRGLEDELPFFAVFAAILQDAGINLYNSFTAIIGKRIFKQIERDALILKRNVEFFFKSPLDALDDLAKAHPNEKMRGFLLGYTAEWRSGGDIVGYLESKAEDLLSDMAFKWRTYAERSTDMGESIITLFFILPMLIVMSAFVFPAQAMAMTTAVLALVIPSISSAIYGVIHMSQPKTYDIVGGDVILSAATGLIVGFASAAVGTQLWLSLVAGLAASTAVYGATVVLQLREIRASESVLPQFIRDVTEYRKMGYDITRALQRIAEENTYNPPFDAVLSAVYRQMKLGMRVSEVEVPSRSWLVRMCFFLLGQVVESGGGTVRCLELLTNFINRVVRARAEARALMRLYQVLSVFTPIGLSFATAIMFALLASFASALAATGGNPAIPLVSMFGMPQSLVESCYLITIAASFSVALLTAKTVDQTAKNTIWITVNMVLAAAGIAFSTQIGSMLLQSLASSLLG